MKPNFLINAIILFFGLVFVFLLFSGCIAPKQDADFGLNVDLNSNDSFSSDTGLIAHYKFDEPLFEKTSADSSGNGLNAFCTDVPCPVFQSGKSFDKSSAFLFDGSTQYFSVPYNSLLDLKENFAVSVWVKTNADTSNQQFQGIVSKGDGNARNYSIFLHYKEIEVQWRVGLWQTLITSGANIEPNIWYHIVYVRKPDFEAIYLNGAMIKTGNSQPAMPINKLPLYIGGMPEWPEESFSGLIDEVRIYNRALTEAEIQNLAKK